MTRGSHSSEVEEAEIDRARFLAGLPNNRKVRSCLRCSTQFDSRGQRFCPACTYDNTASRIDCGWEPQSQRIKVGVKRS